MRKGCSTHIRAPSSLSPSLIPSRPLPSFLAGLTSDANILIRQARVIAQRHLFRYDEPIPVEMLVQQLCDYKHFYTQTGGLRPFGVSFLYAGWDRHRGYQLYMSDPSGNYGGWKAAAMGSNSQSATSTLKSEYRDDLTLAEAKQLAVRILTKAMDTTAPTADRMDVFTLQHVADTPAETTDSHFADAKDRIFQRRLNDEEVGELIAAVAAETAKAGDK